MYKVMVEPSTYENCAEAVSKAFEIFAPDVKGKKVLVKPNVLRGAEPREGITTHPAMVKAVVEHLQNAGAGRIVVGDNPGIFNYGANEACFKKTGLMEASLGHYRNIGEDPVNVPFDPQYLSTVAVSREVLDADLVISLPKFKTHGLTVVTGAIKNSYGILPGAQKAKLHRLAGTPYRFHEVIVGVFKLRPPDLFIVDAVVGMEGNGPASPDLREVGLVLAADNAVALDGTICRMMGLDPERLRFMEKAREDGLGDFDPAGIEVLGELRTIEAFKVPPLGGEAIAGSEEIRKYMESRISLRPKADPALCTACGSCADQCPASALSMEADLPVVDPEACITCFCCQEVCPEKAITLQ